MSMFRRRSSVRSGRPSLLGTAARTATVVGTAQVVSGKVAHSQAERQRDRQDAAAFRSQPIAPPPAGPASSNDDIIGQLEKLGALHQSGVLTDAEFAVQKARILG